MKRIQALSIQIEVNRQRLRVASINGDQDLIQRSQRLLVIFEAEYYDLTKQLLGLRADDCVMVFSELFPDGAVLDQLTYRVLLSGMGTTDRECHVAVPVEAEMSKLVESLVYESVKRRA